MDAGQGIAARFTWHPEYAGRLLSTCARSWLARFPPTNARTRWRWTPPKRARTMRSTRCCGWKAWSAYDLNWAETDPGELADRILEWEWQRENRHELFPFAEMRESVPQQALPPAQASWLDWL